MQRIRSKVVGIGVPAPVTEVGIVQNTANLGWGYKEVKKELEELTGSEGQSWEMMPM